MTHQQLHEARNKRARSFKEMRVKSGFTKIQLSRISGLHRASIDRIESGSKPWSVDSELIYLDSIRSKANE